MPIKRKQQRNRKGRRGKPRTQKKTKPRYMPVGLTTSLRAKCKFLKQFTVNIGASAARFSANGLYDVDPIVGSTTAIGFGELTALYKRFRVLSYHYEFSIVNIDTVPLYIYITNTNFDLGATFNQHYDYARNAFGKVRVLAVTGKNTMMIRGSLSVRQIFGGNVTGSDQFYGTDSANPTNLVFLGIAAQTATGVAISTGVSVQLTLTCFAQFFERKALTS